MPTDVVPVPLVPAMFRHCEAVYNEMYRRSNRLQADGQTTMIVYEGMLTKLVTEDLDLPVPYYTSTRKMLTAMGCVRQLRRGGGTSPSQWELLKEPSMEDYDKALADEEVASSTPTADRQAITMLQAQMKRVEAALGLTDIPLPMEDL